METPVAVAPQSAASKERTPGLPPLVLVGLLAGPFMSMIDSSVVNVALAAIAHGLNTELSTAQWVISSYLLALALGLPASAYFARRFGTRRVYLLSILGFTVTSLACAFAPSLPILILARTLQGFCGAPMVPLAMNILLDPNGVGERGIPAVAGMLLFLAPALGPTIGGLVLQTSGQDGAAWPLIFLINVPIGLLGFLGATRISPDLAGAKGTRAQEGDDGNPSHFDPLGLFLLGGGLALVIYGTTSGVQTSWLASNVWPFWSGGLALLALYLPYALIIRTHPALDLKLLRHPQSALALFLVCLVSIVMASTLLLIPIYVQQIQGRSPLVAGLILLPQGLVMGLGILLGSALTRRWGERSCILIGTIILMTFTGLLLFLELGTPAWLTALLLMGRGLATGLVLTPLLTVMLYRLSQRELPDGNTLFTVTDNLSGSVGIALLATLFQHQILPRIEAALTAHGLPTGSILRQLGSGSSGASAGVPSSTLPAALHNLLGEAAVAGLHDTVLAIVVVAACGVVAAVFVRSLPRRQEPNTSRSL
jgi:EmrB/QacA subfamily drug resistance transporter